MGYIYWSSGFQGLKTNATNLDNESSGVGRLVLEVSREHLSEAVVPCETVNTGLDGMRRNLESLSLRFFSKCLRTDTAFLMRQNRSSGRVGARAWERRMRTILLPAIIFT